METKEDLKPCPFCGGKANLHHFGTKTFEIECGNCGVNFGNSWGGIKTKDECVILWNTRHLIK